MATFFTNGDASKAQLFAETVVSLGLLAILMVTAPLVTLATAAALALVVATALRLMKRNSARWGRARGPRQRKAFAIIQLG